MNTIRFIHTEIDLCTEFEDRHMLIAEVKNEKVVATYAVKVPIPERFLNPEEYRYSVPGVN